MKPATVDRNPRPDVGLANARIRTRLAVLIGALIACIALFIFWYFPFLQDRQQMEAMARKALSIADMTAYTIAPALVFEDKGAMGESFETAKQNRDLVYLAVADKDGHILLSYNMAIADSAKYRERVPGSNTSPDGCIYGEVSPVVFQNREIGRIFLGLSLDDLETEIIRSRTTIGLVSVGVFVFGLLSAIAIGTRITVPLTLFRTLIDQSSDAIEVVDPGTGRFLDANERAWADLGYSRDEFLSMSIFDIDPTVDRHAFERAGDNLRKSGFMKVDGLHRRKDGSTFPVEISTRYVKLDRDYFVSVARDVSEQRKAEEAIRISQERYRMLSESALTGVYLIQDQLFQYVNPVLASIFGYSVEEIVGKIGPRELTAEEDRLLVTENIRRRVEGDIRQLRYGFSGVRKDGTRIDIEVHGGTTTFNGKPAIIGTLIDISERKRAEAALRKNEAQLSESLRIARGGYWEYDVATDQFTFNDQFYSILHTTAEREGGYTMTSARYSERFVHPEDAALVGREIEKALQTDNPAYSQELDHRIIYADGRVGFVSVHIRVDQDARRRTIRTHGVNMDITERKKAEEALHESESRYRATIENAVVGIYRSTVGGTHEIANSRLASMYGFDSPGELLATYTDLNRQLYVKSGRRAEFIALLQQQGVVSGFESQVYRKDRSIIWISENARVIKDRDGATVGFEGTAMDITEQKRAEESAQRLLRAVEQTDEVVFMTDIEGRITYVNPAFERVYGFSEAEAIGATPRILKSGKHDDQHYKDLWKQILSGRSFFGEHINKCKNGEPAIVDVAVSPVYNGDREMSGFIAVQKDITKRKRDEEERETLEQELAQAQKIESIGILAGGIAHDFNNILGIILGHTTLLERGSGDPGRLSSSLGSIRTAVDRGAGLVRQILTFARKSDVLFEPVRMNEIVAETVKMLEETFPKTITLSKNLTVLDPIIEADRTQLHQTLLNLCVNARDAMPKGGSLSLSTGEVDPDAVSRRFPDAEDAPYLVVSVADTGTGMNEATVKRIFEPFFTTKEVGKGTGLGLAVVYGIVKSHRGFIDVKSEPGRGTTFSLYFPLVWQKSDRSVPVVQERSCQGGSETILVVEDEKMLRDLLELVLTANGYTVLTADNGEQALELYEKNRQSIALVVSDLGLPRMDGRDVFLRLKEIDHDINVILASGYLEPQMKAELLKAGARSVIHKPYVPDRILKEIRAVLDMH